MLSASFAIPAKLSRERRPAACRQAGYRDLCHFLGSHIGFPPSVAIIAATSYYHAVAYECERMLGLAWWCSEDNLQMPKRERILANQRDWLRVYSYSHCEAFES